MQHFFKQRCFNSLLNVVISGEKMFVLDVLGALGLAVYSGLEELAILGLLGLEELCRKSKRRLKLRVPSPDPRRDRVHPLLVLQSLVILFVVVLFCFQFLFLDSLLRIFPLAIHKRFVLFFFLFNGHLAVFLSSLLN